MSLNGPTTPAGTGRSPREIDADVASSANATPAQRRGGVCPLADFYAAQAAVPAAREHSYVKGLRPAGGFAGVLPAGDALAQARLIPLKRGLPDQDCIAIGTEFGLRRRLDAAELGAV